MATVAQIVSRVEGNVIDLPSNVSSRVQDFIEKAHRELQDLINFKVMQKEATLSTTVDDHDLGTIPSDFKEYRDRPYHTDDNGISYSMSVLNSREAVLAAISSGPSDTGPPMVLLDEEPAGSETKTWEVYPLPDGLAITSDGEYQVKIPYYAYLSFPSTSDWFTNNADAFLESAATSEAFLRNWDEGRYSVWRAKAYGPLWDQRRIRGGDFLTAFQKDARLRVSNVDTLVPYAGARAPRLMR
jgi:hypothetical protein